MSYNFRITFGTARKLRDEKIVDLLGANVAESVSELLYDLEKIGMACATIMAQSPDGLDENLIDNLGPDDIHQLRGALRLAIINFIQTARPEMSQATEKLIEKKHNLLSKASQTVVTYLEGDTLDKKLEQSISELLNN